MVPKTNGAQNRTLLNFRAQSAMLLKINNLPFFRSVQLGWNRFIFHVDDVNLPRGRVKVHFGPAKFHFLVGIFLVGVRFFVRHLTQYGY